MFFCFDAYSQTLTDKNSELITNYFQIQTNTPVSYSTASKVYQKTLESDVVIEQTGNYNNSYIISNSNNKQEVKQIGDNNNYEYYTYYNSNPSEVNSLQYGDNNSIQIFGQNELAKNISIIQKTNNKTLIIKNY
jgi:hypothetical protein